MLLNSSSIDFKMFGIFVVCISNFYDLLLFNRYNIYNFLHINIYKFNRNSLNFCLYFPNWCRSIRNMDSFSRSFIKLFNNTFFQNSNDWFFAMHLGIQKINLTLHWRRKNGKFGSNLRSNPYSRRSKNIWLWPIWT